MKRTFLLVYLLFSTTLQIFSQELEFAESHDKVLDNILRMHILVSVSGSPEDAPWKTELNKLTIPGRTVSLTLENKEVKIHGGFTPYHVGDTFMLLAQAQVTFLPTEDSGLRYFTSMKALTITLGETIHFFPLGNQKKIDLPSDSWDIKIELAVVAFQPTAEEKEKMDGLIADRDKTVTGPGIADDEEQTEDPSDSNTNESPHRYED